MICFMPSQSIYSIIATFDFLTRILKSNSLVQNLKSDFQSLLFTSGIQ